MNQPSKHPKLNPLGIPYFLIQTFWRVPEKIGKHEGVEFFSTGSHVENEKKNFVFHDVAISSFVQYQSQITKM